MLLSPSADAIATRIDNQAIYYLIHILLDAVQAVDGGRLALRQSARNVGAHVRAQIECGSEDPDFAVASWALTVRMLEDTGLELPHDTLLLPTV